MPAWVHVLGGLLLVGVIAAALFWPAPDQGGEVDSASSVDAASVDATAPAKPEARARKMPTMPRGSSGQPSRERELLLTFSDEAAYQRFLQDIAGRPGLKLLGRLDKLRTARVGFSTPEAVAALNQLAGDGRLSRNYLVGLPPQGQTRLEEITASSVPFTNQWVQWLEIGAISPNWGQGVTVAVLDTGIVAHPSLPNPPSASIDLIGGDEAWHGHGTAVATVIAGQGDFVPGLAPSVNLVSVRVMDSQGVGDSFTLAEGILAAMDAGAQVLNLSLGGHGQSPVVAAALAEAERRGVAVVAAVGNEGIDGVAYPASQESVLAVAAIDAADRHVPFSNQGPEVDIAAPGVAIYAGWTDAGAIEFTGTSAASAFASGALAVVMSENPGWTPTQAVEQLTAQANEAGLPGNDTAYGGGVLSVRRVLQQGESGIVDAAIAGFTITTSDASGTSLQVVVENRGTEPLYNLRLEVEVNDVPRTVSIASLGVGATATEVVPVNVAAATEVGVAASVTTSGASDQFPSNDSMRSRWQVP